MSSLFELLNRFADDVAVVVDYVYHRWHLH